MPEQRAAGNSGSGHDVGQRDSYLDMVMVGIVGAVLALIVVIVLGSVLGSF